MASPADDRYDDPEEPGGIAEMEEGLAVWVMADKCATCIYRPGNLMHLAPGRLAELTRDNLARAAHIVCHSTLLYGEPTRLRPAMCRGYADLPAAPERSTALRLGAAFSTLRFQQPEPKGMIMSLLHRLATTGLTMDIRNRHPSGVPPRSTGWEYTTWDITLHLEGRTLEQELTCGTPGVTPTVYEVMTLWLREACTALAARSAQHWGALTAGETVLGWEVDPHYEAALMRARELREFLGGARCTPWLDAMLEEPQGDGGGAALPRRSRESASPQGGVVEWYDVVAGSSGGVTVRQVLALHVERVAVAGWVIVKDGRYQVAGDGCDEWMDEWEAALERVKERYPREREDGA